MTRLVTSLSILSAAAMLAAGARAQCFESSGASVAGSLQLIDITYNFPDDEGFVGPTPLGFTFPATSMPGAAAITLDHFVATTNGEVFLTDSLGTGVTLQFTGIANLNELRGTVGECPRITPFAYDMDDELSGVGAWDMKVDQVAATSTKVTWENAGGWLTGEEFSFSVTIDVAGTVRMSYGSTGFAGVPGGGDVTVGISSGNSVGTGTELPVDMSTLATSSPIGLIYETFSVGNCDIGGLDLLFVPTGTGWQQVPAQCAAHIPYGAGCYDLTAVSTEAFYQLFPDSTSSSAALSGQSLTFSPNVNGYVVTSGGGTFRTPVTPNVLALGDDDELDVTPTVAFPHVGGPVSTMSVCSNGTVNMGPVGNNDIFIYADVFALLNDPIAAFRSNRDYDPSAGGTISWEESLGVLYVTFSGVFVFNTSAAETFQFQFDCSGASPGTVRMVWTTMTNAVLNDLVLGYAPGGGSVDGGSIVVFSSLPIVTSPDPAVQPLTLSGSPRPIITGGGSGPAVLCTYTVSNVPEFDPVSLPGVGAGALFFGLPGSQIPLGLDLGTAPVDIGMDGCSLYLLPAAQVDISNVITGGPGGTLSFSIAMPQPLSLGLEFYVQALCLLPPGVPANGSNMLSGTPYGGRTSNGLTIRYDTQ